VATFIDLFYRWRNDHLLPPHSELVISILSECLVVCIYRLLRGIFFIDSFNVLCNPPFNESELKVKYHIL
jgi:hypothetical protein